MKGLSLARIAVADLDEIDEYTVEHFGLDQAVRLRQRFQKVFASLVQAPFSAPRRPEYDPPGKTFRYCVALDRFIVVYEPTDCGIRVARVLHGARDLANVIRRDEGRG